MSGIVITEKAKARARQQDLTEEQAREELRRNNYNFLQLEKRSIKEIRRLAKESPAAHEILLLLAEKMNRENAIMCSSQTLQELTGRSRPTVTRAIKVLRDEKWVQVVKIGTANCYLINNAVFWQSAGDRKHSHFRAAIVASASEQDEDPVAMAKTKLKHFPYLEIREAVQSGADVLVTNEELPPPDQGELGL